VGQVESVGEDVFDINKGDVVLCNSLLSSGDLAHTPDEILIAWTGSGQVKKERKMLMISHYIINNCSDKAAADNKNNQPIFHVSYSYSF
jgi:hypothetical protein